MSTPDAAPDPAAGAPPTRSRRSGRLGLLVLALPFAVGGIGYGLTQLGPSEPVVALAAPAGYRAIADAYFAYAVPASWKEDDSATTATGTYLYSGGGGWVGEVLAERRDAPTLDEAAPAALGVFRQPVSAPFTLTGGHPVTVPGAATAFAYALVRGGAPSATVVDAWSQATSTEIWLAVHADPATEATVVGSLRA